MHGAVVRHNQFVSGIPLKGLREIGGLYLYAHNAVS